MLEGAKGKIYVISNASRGYFVLEQNRYMHLSALHCAGGLQTIFFFFFALATEKELTQQWICLFMKKQMVQISSE